MILSYFSLLMLDSFSKNTAYMFSEVYETLEQQPAAVTITPTLKSSIFSLGVHGHCRKKKRFTRGASKQQSNYRI